MPDHPPAPTMKSPERVVCPSSCLPLCRANAPQHRGAHAFFSCHIDCEMCAFSADAINLERYSVIRTTWSKCPMSASCVATSVPRRRFMQSDARQTCDLRAMNETQTKRVSITLNRRRKCAHALVSLARTPNQMSPRIAAQGEAMVNSRVAAPGPGGKAEVCKTSIESVRFRWAPPVRF